MKRFLAVLLASTTLLGTSVFAGDIRYVSSKPFTEINCINTYENAYGFDTVQYRTTAYYIENGTAYVPIETLGADKNDYSCKYYFDDNGDLRITFSPAISSSHYARCRLSSGSRIAYADRMQDEVETISLSVAPKVIDGHFCIAARTLPDLYHGCRVSFDPSTKILTLNFSQA